MSRLSTDISPSTTGLNSHQQQLLGLNLDFLRILRAAVAAGPSVVRAELRLSDATAARLMQCDTPALMRMAGCGLSLYSLQLHRTDQWQQLAQQSAQAIALEAGPRPPHGDDALALQVVDFLQCALFFAWHLAQQDAQAARLLLGMSPETAVVLRTLELGQCRHIAQRYTKLLSPRWSHHRYFWPDLLRHGLSGDPAQGKLVQLLGTQLAAQDLEPSAIARLTMEPD